MRDPSDILSDIFGFSGFRPFQQQIVGAVMAGRNQLAVMPTGAGKSLCYQIPAIARPGAGLVISPLVALMEDQVRALASAGVAAGSISAATPATDRQALYDALDAGALDLLYVAPERVTLDGFAARLVRAELSLIAIDEAHCVSEWGHDFRPDYRRLREFCDLFPSVPRVAMTATADQRTRSDILDQLGIAARDMVVAGFDRPNIRYDIAAKTQLSGQLRDFLAARRGESGIVYAPTRAAVDRFAAMLRTAGFNAVPYHAGLDAGTRSANARAFSHGDDVIVVATIAFGMGIDKPDVRFVVHVGLPRSIEAYYQETGRAGRDGDPARAQMFYGTDDIARARQFIAASDAGDDKIRDDHRRLDALIALCETPSCRRAPLLAYFDDDAPETCGNCDNCLAPPELVDATEPARMLLSAIYRTGQRYGLGHIVDVLAGKSTPRTQKLGHETLGVFGIGNAVAKPLWQSLQRQLVARRAIVVDVEHGGMQLGSAARAILRGEDRVEIRKPDAGKPRTRRRSGSDGPEDPLFNALREVRRVLAVDAKIPAYVIFHDATLRAMAAARPASLDDMANVQGVGQKKLERYGPAFLDVIRAAP